MIGKTISHYHILGQVGEGGMGVVYVAEDTRLGRRVAFKVPHAGRDERHYRARFLREARSVSSLNHPNIAAVYDYGESEEGQPYIVMELVTGQTLNDILMGTGLSLQRAVEIISDVAAALAEAHAHGIIHRDIKPSNVVINDRGEVKVLDFGLAKQLEDAPAAARADSPDALSLLSSQTRSDVVIGTPLYLSPEQARGARVDGRSDIFALGALLYECIAGRPAFSGSNVIEIGAQVLHIDPPLPSQFNSRIPADLDRLTMKALAKKPEERFQSAAEMADQLTRVGLKLAGSNTIRTRRLATGPYGMRTSALTTLTRHLRHPRFSPLALAAMLVVALLCVWGFTRLSRSRPHQPSPEAVASYEQGVAAMRDGAFYRASLLFKEAVERDNKYALAYARLAEAKTEMDFLDAAKDDLLTVQSLVPERNVLAERERLYLDAVTATVRRDYRSAIAAYTRLVSLDPDSPQARVDLGRAFEKNNEIERAIESYTEAATRAPSYVTPHLRLGLLHARRKDLASAISNFDRADQLYAAAGDTEGRTEVAYQRGRLFVELRKHPEARRELERALAMAQETNNLHQQVRASLHYSYVIEDRAAARARAMSAVETAQTSGMHDLAAYGLVTLGNLALLRADHPEAERSYERALESARAHKVKRYEAFALLQMGSLREQQNRRDEAQPLLEQAREFYLQGGYRKEAGSALILLVRLQRKRGDYENALRVIDDQIRVTEQSGDAQLLGFLYQERGLILQAQERMPQALTNFTESLKIYRQLDDRTLMFYGLVNTAAVQRHLGRFDEMNATLAQLEEMLAANDVKKGEIPATVRLHQAAAALSFARIAEAGAKAREAATLFPVPENAKPISMQLEVQLVLCRVEAASGRAARGLALCSRVVALAEAAGDSVMAAMARLATAEARLEAGDARDALESARLAAETFARVGRIVSEWRAFAVAVAAAQRDGDTEAERIYTERAASALQRLEATWGADAMQGFLARPDVRALNRAQTASVATR